MAGNLQVQIALEMVLYISQQVVSRIKQAGKKDQSPQWNVDSVPQQKCLKSPCSIHSNPIFVSNAIYTPYIATRIGQNHTPRQKKTAKCLGKNPKIENMSIGKYHYLLLYLSSFLFLQW